MRAQLENVTSFWLEHGMDPVHGGIYTCLDRSGNIFSTDKSVWMQGRCGWIFAYGEWYGSAQERGYCVSALYSDDHGVTWKSAPCIGRENCANESRLVETQKGILWFMRTKGVRACRSGRWDGGITWNAVTDLDLPEARCCDMGAISLSAKEGYEDMVRISRVSDPAKRLDMEIRISLDGGETFPEVFSLMPGDAMPGYSDMCIIQEETPVVGLLHCRNNHVMFSWISLQTLTGGKYDNTSRNCWLQ